MVNRKIQTQAAGTYLDVVGIVQWFGGRTELIRDLERYEIADLSIAAVDKWQSRGQIPAQRQMDLDTLATRKGKKFDLGSFIRRPAKKKAA